jgi:thiosulfate/3-mercaptopyruvate sulfurtransferase
MPTINTPLVAGSLVDARWLAGRLDDPTVLPVEVDVTATSYEQGHIPGAVLWNPYTDLRGRDYRALDISGVEALLERSGISPATTLVFYGYAAHLGYWLASAHGHANAVVIDEPREHWDGPWSTETPTPTPSRYSLRSATHLVTKSEVLGRRGVLLDVRAEPEYAGEIFWPSGAPEPHGRPGHVPGALNLPISHLRSETGFRPADEMQAALHKHGLTAETPVTTYCTIGNRASQAWYALTHLLGFLDVSVYHGGWAEWGSDPTAPIERKQ